MTQRSHRVGGGLQSRLLCTLAVVTVVASCGGSTAEPDPQPDPQEETFVVPAQGSATTFDVANWNIEWFGSTGNGPDDEDGQLARVKAVIEGIDFDLWGVQEVSGGAHFASLVAQLDGYDGLLATDARVLGGVEYYSGFGDTELKVGLIYKTEHVQILGARIILTDFDHEFAGRPPLEVNIRITVGGVETTATVIVLHAKANTQLESWERRQAGAEALATFLEDEWPDRPVWVIGDWNDDIDESITSGRDTPYRVLVDAAPEWSFVTSPLVVPGATSILGFDDIIDHQLASDEAMAWYQSGSVQVFRADSHISGYEDSTSDHLPVLSRYVISN